MQYLYALEFVRRQFFDFEESKKGIETLVLVENGARNPHDINLICFSVTMISVAFLSHQSLHHGNRETRKTLEQTLIFQIGTLNPHGINERFSFD